MIYEVAVETRSYVYVQIAALSPEEAAETATKLVKTGMLKGQSEKIYYAKASPNDAKPVA